MVSANETGKNIYLLPKTDSDVIYTKNLPGGVIFRKKGGNVILIDHSFSPDDLAVVINAFMRPEHPGGFAELNGCAEQTGIDRRELLTFARSLARAGILKITGRAPARRNALRAAKHKLPRLGNLFAEGIISAHHAPASLSIALAGTAGILSKLKSELLSKGVGKVSVVNLEGKNRLLKIKALKNAIGIADLVVCWNDPPDTDGALLVNKLCVVLNKPCVYAGIEGDEALLGPVVLPHRTPCYRCFYTRAKESEFKEHEYILKRKYFLDPGREKALREKLIKAVSAISLFIARNPGTQRYLNTVYVIHDDSSVAAPAALLRKNDCPDCDLGMQRRGIQFNGFDIPENAVISLDRNRKVIYTENGFRAVPARETLNKINKISGRFGIINGDIRDRRGRVLALAADPMGNNVRRCSAGKGLSYEQKKTSAAIEAVERYCSKIHPRDKLLTAPYAAVRGAAKDPRMFHLSKKFPVVFSDDLTIDWNWGYSLIRRAPVLVPSNLVYCCYSPTAKAKPLNLFWDSNGLGAGNCMEEAILHGILELVERDAFIIVYQNGLVMPDINARSSQSKQVHAMLDRLDALRIAYYVKSYMTDIEIPTMTAFLAGQEGGYPAFACAAGTHLDPETALLRALTEALQLYPRFWKKSVWLRTSSIEHLYKKGAASLQMADFKDKSSGNLAENIEICIKAFSRYPTDVIVVNLTRQYAGFPVVRVLIDALQPVYIPSYPRYSERMFAVPRILGYRNTDSREEEISNGYLCGFGGDHMGMFNNKGLLFPARNAPDFVRAFAKGLC